MYDRLQLDRDRADWRITETKTMETERMSVNEALQMMKIILTNNV